ncbi:hypothetical protein CJF42_20610 [Pseudoalteromonas sp. NBT06-2]|uniref:tight adherence pilus pseudopilin TadF n=1 Tax=Pseudoalteromonas sp. NBT06-2 TaxID=2025950 RepID=UPI000BA63052|nr:tight adherence pilus pseudopilin TadF [Pseudoalteromonas sp. NBT06-2]PAJ72557.1 hypothetical protein CJF42_20610 [Pseudoalteromonas sp. NBT06-2]
MKFNQKSQIKYQKGIVAIEFIFVLPIVILVILLSFDLSRYFQQQGQLDRLSYSLATMISHRQQYYLDMNTQKIKQLDQQQVTELARIARNQLNDENIAINVHSLVRNVEPALQSSFSDGSAQCQWQSSSTINQNLPTITSANLFKEPTIFVVELCQPLIGFSLFSQFSGAGDFTKLYTRSLTVQR